MHDASSVNIEGLGWFIFGGIYYLKKRQQLLIEDGTHGFRYLDLSFIYDTLLF